jgi:protein-S-isoprenylcysteine O-methyltransferase Ste14
MLFLTLEVAMVTFDHHPKILVTGATGKTGGSVVAQLLEKGFPVRAIVRSRDRRSEWLDRLGAETVVADLFDVDQMVVAMRGTVRAYYCPPFHPYMIQSAAAFVVAARESKLEAIVGLSQWTASTNHPSLQTRQLWLVERQPISKRSASMNEQISDNPGVIAFPPALYAVTLLVGLGLSFIFPVSFLPRLISLPLAALAMIGAGWLSISAFRTMSLAQTGIDPAKPTTVIVSDGVFRVTRNPLYLSLTLLYIAISLLFSALWALLLLLPLLAIVQIGVIQREERYLERKFGDEYLRYKTQVRRWI